MLVISPRVASLLSARHQIKNKLWRASFFFGDLCGSRTRVDGMKTRCTNRYTKRPLYNVNYNKFYSTSQEESTLK